MAISQQSQTLFQIKYRKYEMDFSSCSSVARKTTFFICFFTFGEITRLEMRIEKKH